MTLLGWTFFFFWCQFKVIQHNANFWKWIPTNNSNRFTLVCPSIYWMVLQNFEKLGCFFLERWFFPPRAVPQHCHWEPRLELQVQLPDTLLPYHYRKCFSPDSSPKGGTSLVPNSINKRFGSVVRFSNLCLQVRPFKFPIISFPIPELESLYISIRICFQTKNVRNILGLWHQVLTRSLGLLHILCFGRLLSMHVNAPLKGGTFPESAGCPNRPRPKFLQRVLTIFRVVPRVLDFGLRPSSSGPPTHRIEGAVQR